MLRPATWIRLTNRRPDAVERTFASSVRLSAKVLSGRKDLLSHSIASSFRADAGNVIPGKYVFDGLRSVELFDEFFGSERIERAAFGVAKI